MSHIRRFLFTKKTLVITSGVIVIIIGSLVVLSLTRQRDVTKKPDNSTTQNKTTETPKYRTVLPNNKSTDELGGWTRVSPPNNDPVYAYADKINNTPISVSQQPLPESFKDNVDGQLAELAKKFNATTKIDASNTSIYVGTSAKGPQSAIFTKDELLILIKSKNKIDDTAWIKYVESLN